MNPPGDMKLPVLATVADAWRELIPDWPPFLRLAAAPFVISVVGDIVLNLPLVGDHSQGGGIARMPVIRGMIYLVVLWLLLAPVFTAWHRHIILGPQLRDPRPSYRFAAAEWRYAAKAILLAVLLALIGIAMLMGLGVGATVLGVHGSTFGPAALWLPLALAFLVGTPWLLILPAAALDRPLRLREAATLTRGNRLALFAVICVASVHEVLGLVVGEWRDDRWNFLVLRLLQAPVQLAFLAVTVGASSFSYLRLVERRS